MSSTLLSRSSSSMLPCADAATSVARHNSFHYRNKGGGMIRTRLLLTASALVGAAALATASGAAAPHRSIRDATAYRACSDIPGIVYQGNNEWSTRGWVSVGNGHQIQAQCSVVSTGGGG
jgi:hypothetical protein